MYTSRYIKDSQEKGLEGINKLEKAIISVGSLSITAELYDTPTAKLIMQSLPLEGTVNVWGEEIYFEIPLKIELEPEARADVDVGELGYWPSGPAFCIFFGPTPVSTSNKPRAYSPVNIFGRVIGDCSSFGTIVSGTKVSVQRMDKE